MSSKQEDSNNLEDEENEETLTEVDAANENIQRVIDARFGPGAGKDVDGEEVPSVVAEAGERMNVMDILNELFPDEDALIQIELVQARLAETQAQMQKEIELLQAELRRNQDPERMQLIQEMISDLLDQMSRIREKATESEAVVRNITKDIQILDTAKKNLINSMTTLKRLQMLVNALTQLEELVKEKRYHEVSQTLSAVNQISATFKSFMSVPRVAQVWKRIHDAQSELKNQLDADFDAFYLQDTSKQIKPSLITEACDVVDVLGDDFRSHLVERYVNLELKEYRRIFRSTDEAGQLDNISRRFAWFRRLLHTHETEQGRVFPSDWKVAWHLLAKFVDITRDDMAMLLVKAKPTLSVKVLLENLQIVNEFESSMAKKWVTPLHTILSTTAGPHTQPIKTISSAFEPHLSIFVDAQEKLLAEMLAPHRRAKGRQPAPPRQSLDVSSNAGGAEGEEPETPVLVLPSSTDLFYFYGQSLEQCAKLSTNQALFDLCTLHRKWLKIYAEEVLIAGLKRPPTQSRRSADTRYDPKELKHACLLINTADYCQTTASELEDKLKSKIDDDFKEKVSFQNERDVFVSVVSAAIVILLRELESACDAAFMTMARTTWTGLNQVSGQSNYAGDLVKAAEQVVEMIKPLVEQKKYLRNFFDKASSLIISKFTNAIVRSRPLKEIGAEQLIIDLQAVKAYLLSMPGESLVTQSYTRGLTKSTGRLEALLKVIVTPVDPAENFILNYTLLIGDQSSLNFQKILDLKGTPKNQQNDLLDNFLRITSTQPELESTSFLSSLDMEPAGPGQLAGSLVSPGGSRVSLPSAVTNNNESIFAALTSPPSTGPSTGSSMADTISARMGGGEKREVFSGLSRFVTFGLRKDTAT